MMEINGPPSQTSPCSTLPTLTSPTLPHHTLVPPCSPMWTRDYKSMVGSQECQAMWRLVHHVERGIENNKAAQN